jgi:hypothetical protein
MASRVTPSSRVSHLRRSAGSHAHERAGFEPLLAAVAGAEECRARRHHVELLLLVGEEGRMSGVVVLGVALATRGELEDVNAPGARAEVLAGAQEADARDLIRAPVRFEIFEALDGEVAHDPSVSESHRRSL